MGDVPSFVLSSSNGILLPNLVVSILSYLSARFVGQNERLLWITKDHAARIIQYHWRQRSLRIHDQNLKKFIEPSFDKKIQLVDNARLKAILTIQKSWKSYRLRCKLETYFSQVHAAKTIQRWWKSVLLNRNLRNEREKYLQAIIIIQKSWKSYRLRCKLETYFSQVHAAKTIQRWWRSYCLRRDHILKNMAAIVIQKHFRGFEVRKNSSNEIQMVRERLSKANLKALNHPELKLCERAKKYVQMLLNEHTTVTKVLQILKGLEDLTRMSSEVTKWLCLDNGPKLHFRIVSAIMELMGLLNHSEAHEEILYCALGLIFNLMLIPNVAKDTTLWLNTTEITKQYSSILSSSKLLIRSSSLDELTHLNETLSHVMGSNNYPKKTNSVTFVTRGLPHRGVGGLGYCTSSISKSTLLSCIADLLKTRYKSKPGTVGYRLFIRACCLLTRHLESLDIVCDESSAQLIEIMNIVDTIFTNLSRRLNHLKTFNQLPIQIGIIKNTIDNPMRVRVLKRITILKSLLKPEFCWFVARPAGYRQSSITACEYLRLKLFLSLNKNIS